MFWLAKISILCTSLVLLACSSGTGLKSLDISSSNTAHNFSARDSRGYLRKLSELRGKYVLLNFWASWCQPCIQEMGSLERVATRFSKTRLVVLAVAIDDPLARVRRFKALHKLKLPIWIDTRGEAKEKFAVRSVPSTWLLNSQGEVAPLLDPDTGKLAKVVVGARHWDKRDVLHFLRKQIR